MNTKNISLALLKPPSASRSSACGDSQPAKGTADRVQQRTLSAPEHKNTSTEPGGKGTTTAPPASSK